MRGFLVCIIVLSAVVSTMAQPKGHLYSIMGVPPDATLDQIKSRYKKLARELHPDSTTATNVELVKKKFIEVTEAYEILTDPLKKKSYDNENNVQDLQENNQWLSNNLFSQNFDGVEIGTDELEAIWRNEHPDKENSYAVFLWSNNYPDCVDASKPYKQLATKLKGTTIRVASLRCDWNINICRRLVVGDPPAVFFFSEGQKQRYHGKYELQQLLEASIAFIRIPERSMITGTGATFERCANFPVTLDLYWMTLVSRITLDLVTFEYSPCFDCGNEIMLMLSMMNRINPITLYRVNCEDLDSEVCEQYGKRTPNRAWSYAHTEIQTSATISPKKGLMTSKAETVYSVWFKGKHSASEYVQFALQWKQSVSHPLQSLSHISRSEHAYAVAFYDSTLGELFPHFEMFAKKMRDDPITYEKNRANRVIVERVDCAKTAALCREVGNRPILAVYPFGLKAKARPPFYSQIVDMTQLVQVVTRDAIPLRLYELNSKNFHEKVVRQGGDPKKIKPWIVLYNAGQWCPPCNQMRPVWKQLAREAQSSRDPQAKKLRVATVDCDDPNSKQGICREMGIDNYPTMIFYQGNVERHYEGNREASSILDWASSSIDNPVENPSGQELWRMYNTQHQRPYLVLLNAGSWCPPCMQITKPWRDLARIIAEHKDIISGIGEVNCDQDRQACMMFDVSGYPTVMIIRPNNRIAKAEMPSSNDKSVGALLRWVREYFPTLPSEAGAKNKKRIGP